MADHHDAQDYTANGPSNFGFRIGGTNIEVGVDAGGREIGVHGVGVGRDDKTGLPATGVRGESARGYGVIGVATRSGFPGVWGRSEFNDGVLGTSDSSIGVKGSGRVGVSGLGTEGEGVVGHTESGAGVKGSSNTGAGVEGSSEKGRGAIFKSQSEAQLQLVPRRLQTPPTTGQAGDLLVILVAPPRQLDEKPLPEVAELWFCLRGDSGGQKAAWGKVDFSQIQQ